MASVVEINPLVGLNCKMSIKFSFETLNIILELFCTDFCHDFEKGCLHCGLFFVNFSRKIQKCLVILVLFVAK